MSALLPCIALRTLALGLLAAVAAQAQATGVVRGKVADADSLPDHETAPLTTADIDRLTSADFEAAVAALYRADGYQV